MLDRILDKYFMKKLVYTLIDRARATMYLDFYCIPVKDKLEIYVNYAEPREKLYECRKVCVINRFDVFSAIANFSDYEKRFKEKIEYALKEKN